MKRIVVLTCVFLIGALGTIGAEREPLNDGEPHGDPPYLIEDGWTPLLNGKDHYCPVKSRIESAG